MPALERATAAAAGGLSTMHIAPKPCAAAATAGTSTTLSSGLVTISTTTAATSRSITPATSSPAAAYVLLRLWFSTQPVCWNPRLVSAPLGFAEARFSVDRVLRSEHLAVRSFAQRAHACYLRAKRATGN